MQQCCSGSDWTDNVTETGAETLRAINRIMTVTSTDGGHASVHLSDTHTSNVSIHKDSDAAPIFWVINAGST